MKTTTLLCWTLALTLRLEAEDLLDRVDEALTITAREDQFRARLSGLADLEVYQYQQPAPGLLYADGDTLVAPRLSLFLDTQVGPRIYGFVQTRVDRGFDPSDDGAEIRLDEYALRLTPWDDGRLNVQVGKFATVVGNWATRHASWENPFVNAPLPYENLVPIYDAEAPASAADFGGMVPAEKYEYVPVIWGPSYATGASAAGQWGLFTYAMEVKNAGLSSRPEAWPAGEGSFAHPTCSTRLGFRPNPTWDFGVSASEGPYFLPAAGPTLPPGRDIFDYDQRVLGQDIGFAWHHLQLWAEIYEARFEVPQVGDADTVAYYIEAKYKITPQLFGALRWNEQLFSTVPDGEGGRAPWSRDLWRSDVALGYRLTAHHQLKVQYSLQQEDGAASDPAHLFAAQLTVRF